MCLDGMNEKLQRQAPTAAASHNVDSLSRRSSHQWPPQVIPQRKCSLFLTQGPCVHIHTHRWRQQLAAQTRTCKICSLPLGAVCRCQQALAAWHAWWQMKKLIRQSFPMAMGNDLWQAVGVAQRVGDLAH